MKLWLAYLMAQARRYTAIDFTFLKLVLVSFGILLGSYFATFFPEHHCTDLDYFHRIVGCHNEGNLQETMKIRV